MFGKGGGRSEASTMIEFCMFWTVCKGYMRSFIPSHSYCLPLNAATKVLPLCDTFRESYALLHLEAAGARDLLWHVLLEHYVFCQLMLPSPRPTSKVGQLLPG